MCDSTWLKVSYMRQIHLRKRLARYIHEKRGDRSLREFASRYSLSKDTVSRIETLEQNVTIDTLEHMCKIFRCDIADLFPTNKKEKDTDQHP